MPNLYIIAGCNGSGNNGKVQKISPFILAEERSGKDFVKQWRKENKK